ncbi:MAG: hypothetical protein ABI221_03140 [Candidatus Saccharimonadales bacterium]
MDKLLSKLAKDFPHIKFVAGELFSWSPKEQTVIYASDVKDEGHPVWSLLHEVGHGLLKHHSYSTDFELVKLEAAAWQRATQLASHYSYQIDGEHIQDCLDTYRDWLHQRSTCPTCLTTSLQRDMTTYCCYNCNAEWRVTRAKICRPYRRLQPASS